MFAIFQDGSSQYKVKKGDVVQLDWKKTLKEGDTLKFDKVLMIIDGTKTTVGMPYVEGCEVAAEVTNPLEKGKKLHVVKFKRRKSYDVRIGHRQKYTLAEIKDIKGVS